MTGSRGHALLLATLLAVVAFSAWALAFQTTRDLVHTEEVLAARVRRDDTVTRALARGLRLMRTGLPPSAGYACIVADPEADADDDDGGVFDVARVGACTLTFERDLDGAQWTLTAEPSTEEEFGMLPDVPTTFARRGEPDDDQKKDDKKKDDQKKDDKKKDDQKKDDRKKDDKKKENKKKDDKRKRR